MACAVSDGGYRAEDLDWIRGDLGIAHLELDPRGSLIVSRASDEHETAVAVLHDQAVRQLEPPPLLVVEVGSPSTGVVDRTRKLADYRLGGAGVYVLVDLPGIGVATGATFEAHDFGANTMTTTAGAITLLLAGRSLTLDLTILA
jgi:Uma2 family endonuclease